MKKKIEDIIKELKQYPREPKSLTWIESVLEKHLQEPTEESVEELIEKYKKRYNLLNIPGLYELEHKARKSELQNIIQDLQDLLPEAVKSKEEEVERCAKCGNCIKRDYDDEYCCECGAKL